MNTKKIITSPFFIFEFSNDSIRASDLINNQRLKFLHPYITKLCVFCLDGKTNDECLDEGFTEDVLKLALNHNIILHVDNPVYESSRLWEDRNWLRAAYLTFSQLDLKYKETVSKKTTQTALINHRKEIIEEYKEQSLYPTLKFREGERFPLLKPTNSKRQEINTLKNRRSVRNFKESPVSFRDFSYILYEASNQLRLGELDKNSVNPIEIFNSYFCWGQIYIIVQNVEGIEKAVYQYDFKEHSLIKVGAYSDDKDIYSCIQNQKWISGGGFCVFICAFWERYYWVYRHSRAYINLLIQVGEFGQEFFQSATRLGLGGWGTPAISESLASELLGIDSKREEALYFLKFGIGKASDSE